MIEEGKVRQSTYYEVLGVTENATLKEIRRAYLKLSMVEHPDKGGDAERFAAVQKAYAVLTSDAERCKYDESITSQQRNGYKSSTVVVHGQTYAPVSAPYWHEPTTNLSMDKENPGMQNGPLMAINELTGKINRSLQTFLQTEDRSSTNVTSALADLYLQRAKEYIAMNRLHHAEFDVREALALRPGCERATAILECIRHLCQEEAADFD